MRSKRRQRGSAIAETGPAMFLFFILIFFPLMDLIGLAAIYCCGWYANFMCVRELSVRKKVDEASVKNEVNTEFMATGIANFIGIRNINHSVVYTDSVNGQPGVVSCTTSITGKPFLTVPIPGVTVPGLNSDITFTTATERPREVNQ